MRPNGTPCAGGPEPGGAMRDRADESQSALVRVRDRVLAFLGRGGLVLGAIVVMVLVLAIVLLLVTWFTGLGPELPGREHY